MELANLGQYVSERRKALGLRQSDLADVLGYSNQAISKFEAGESQISLSVVPKLCNLLACSIDDFFARNPNPTRPEKAAEDINGDLLAKNIRLLRQNAHRSLTQEAALYGISKNTLVAYEKGSSLPSLDAIEKIADTAKIPCKTLLYEELRAVAPVTPLKKMPRWLMPVIISSVVVAIVLSVGLTYPLWAPRYGNNSATTDNSAIGTKETTTSPNTTGGSDATTAASSGSLVSSDSASSEASSTSSDLSPYFPGLKGLFIQSSTGLTTACTQSAGSHYVEIWANPYTYFKDHSDLYYTEVYLKVGASLGITLSERSGDITIWDFVIPSSLTSGTTFVLDVKAIQKADASHFITGQVPLTITVQ
jgi:transcriptional regulator with XRE-family HTH domain